MFAARAQSLLVTLHVGYTDNWLLATCGEKEMSAALPAALPPAELIQAAWSQLESLLGSQPAVLLRARWRIVLPAAFGHSGKLEHDRWDLQIAAATANALESVCPMSLDDLVVAAIPLGMRRTWAAGLPRSELETWLAAAKRAGITVEGIWSNSTALVDYILENPLTAGTQLDWTDGHVRVEIASEASANNGAASITRASVIHRIATRIVETEPACSAEFIEVFQKNTTADRRSAEHSPINLPIAHWPALAAHRLTFIDTSESLNAARGEFATPIQAIRRHKPLIRPLIACTIAAFVFGIACLLRAHERQTQAATASQAIQQLVSNSHSATPIADMERQIKAWRQLTEDDSLGTSQPHVLERLTSLVKQLPSSVPLNLTTLRLSGNTLTLEGTVKSQDDARQIEAALAQVPGAHTDGIHTSEASRELVSFSLNVLFGSDKAVARSDHGF